MHLLAYWKWANYAQDLGAERGFHFNSNQRRLHDAIEPGERLWLVSGRSTPTGARYVLLACLLVADKELNPPSYHYGRHRLWGDARFSVDYDPEGLDVADLLLRLEFSPPSPIASRERIGQSLQTIRALAPADDALLRDWAARHAVPRQPAFRRAE
jgi:hypothetical protein